MSKATETPLRRSRTAQWADIKEGDAIEVEYESSKYQETVFRMGTVRRAVPYDGKNKVLCLGRNSLGNLRKNGYQLLWVGEAVTEGNK